MESVTEAEAIFYLARKYEILDLEYVCLSYIRDGLSPDTVCLAYEIARLFDDKELEEISLNIIRNKTGQVLLSQGFRECDVSTVAAIMGQKVLNIASELELFNALDSWSSHNGYALESNKKPVEQIQFLRMTHEEFVQGPMLSELLSNEEKLKIVGCLTMQGKDINGVYDMPVGFTEQTDRICIDRSDENIFRILNELRETLDPPFFTCPHYTDASINHIVMKCHAYNERRDEMFGLLRQRGIYWELRNPLHTVMNEIMQKNGLDVESRKHFCDYIRSHSLDLKYLLKMNPDDIECIEKLRSLGSIVIP